MIIISIILKCHYFLTHHKNVWLKLHLRTAARHYFSLFRPAVYDFCHKTPKILAKTESAICRAKVRKKLMFTFSPNQTLEMSISCDLYYRHLNEFSNRAKKLLSHNSHILSQEGNFHFNLLLLFLKVQRTLHSGIFLVPILVLYCITSKCNFPFQSPQKVMAQRVYLMNGTTDNNWKFPTRKYPTEV